MRDTVNSIRQLAFPAIRLSFVFLVICIAITFCYMCIIGIRNDSSIDGERFNQIWVCLSGLVGTIVGYVIREFSSDSNDEGKAIRLESEVNMLGAALHEKQAHINYLNAKSGVNDESARISTIKNK